MNGTLATYPTENTIVGNHFDTVGIYMKQVQLVWRLKSIRTRGIGLATPAVTCIIVLM